MRHRYAKAHRLRGETLLVQVDLGADRAKRENAAAAKLEYQVSKSWSFEATGGDAPSVGAELLWSRDF